MKELHLVDFPGHRILSTPKILDTSYIEICSCLNVLCCQDYKLKDVYELPSSLINLTLICFYEDQDDFDHFVNHIPNLKLVTSRVEPLIIIIMPGPDEFTMMKIVDGGKFM